MRRAGSRERLSLIQRIDWFRVLCDLQREGMTNRDVSQAIEVPRTTLIAWKNGAEPNHHDGEKLLVLWTSATSTARDAAPRTSIPPWLMRVR